MDGTYKTAIEHIWIKQETIEQQENLGKSYEQEHDPQQESQQVHFGAKRSCTYRFRKQGLCSCCGVCFFPGIFWLGLKPS